MAARIAPEERLTNLVVALMATHGGLTRAQIFQSVSGYRQRYETGVSAASLERMFERDKDELRGLGVPLETLANPADPADLREARYRIPRSEYDLPDDIEFSAAELALLRLAGSVWEEESMSEQARSGMRKLRTLGMEIDEPIIGFQPRVTAREKAFTPLQDAMDSASAVTFSYIKPGETQASTRTVFPLALVDYEARWHLHAYDPDAAGERTFLLSRMSNVEVDDQRPFDRSLHEGAAERALQGLTELAQRQTALLEVTPGSEASLRLGRRATPALQGIYVGYVDRNIFADELASYGPEVRVVEPEDLRELVILRLRTIMLRHERDDHE
ncbi:helix-turn-helix transcriptional regulator [Microbacterium sp. YY-01]|uniref:helix-turn-helix transcriptional regulator n=1 Tax=Microbacterium sp. YY-01 TaxID=3421634 RepID=UPI003D16AC13